MIQVLVTALIVLVVLFLMVIMLCLMTWVIVRLLRFLFPQRFGPGAKKPKPKKVKKVVVEDEEEA